MMINLYYRIDLFLISAPCTQYHRVSEGTASAMLCDVEAGVAMMTKELTYFREHQTISDLSVLTLPKYDVGYRSSVFLKTESRRSLHRAYGLFVCQRDHPSACYSLKVSARNPRGHSRLRWANIALNDGTTCGVLEHVVDCLQIDELFFFHLLLFLFNFFFVSRIRSSYLTSVEWSRADLCTRSWGDCVPSRDGKEGWLVMMVENERPQGKDACTKSSSFILAFTTEHSCVVDRLSDMAISRSSSLF